MLQITGRAPNKEVIKGKRWLPEWDQEDIQTYFKEIWASIEAFEAAGENKWTYTHKKS